MRRARLPAWGGSTGVAATLMASLKAELLWNGVSELGTHLA